jgi:hypothetical protein
VAEGRVGGGEGDLVSAAPERVTPVGSSHESAQFPTQVKKVLAKFGLQAAIAGQQPAIRRALGERLDAGVDHLVGRFLILGPMGDQPPAHQHHPVGALHNDHRHQLPRGDVIASDQAIEAVGNVNPTTPFSD